MKSEVISLRQIVLMKSRADLRKIALWMLLRDRNEPVVSKLESTNLKFEAFVF